jgi:hypothetical protein
VCQNLGIPHDFSQTRGSVPIAARPSTRCALPTNRALATSRTQRTFRSLWHGVDALTCRWYQNLAARASYAPAPMKGEKAAQVLASMPPRWLPATRPAPPCYFLLHQPFPTSRLTLHSYGVLAGALALAGEPLSPKVGSILAGKRAGRARSGQDRREQPISAAPAQRDVQRGRLNAVLVVYGVRCTDASCCVVCCLSACSGP